MSAAWLKNNLYVVGRGFCLVGPVLLRLLSTLICPDTGPSLTQKVVRSFPTKKLSGRRSGNLLFRDFPDNLLQCSSHNYFWNLGHKCHLKAHRLGELAGAGKMVLSNVHYASHILAAGLILRGVLLHNIAFLPSV
jgi:hypothetical protein